MTPGVLSAVCGLAAGVARVDRWLLGAMAAGVVLGAQGFGWGRYDCLNNDRMAFKSVMSPQRAPLEPASLRKPPLYTYWNFFFSRWPAEFIGRNLFWAPIEVRKEFRVLARVALARFWNLAMFAGCVAIVFLTIREAFGAGAARAGAWILATSAGFIPYQVYLTTDLAVVFLMLGVFALAVRITRNPSPGVSIAAGLLAGLCAAVKYNGLAIAVLLPLAHLLASRGNPFTASLKRPAAWLCGLAVPVGFVLGNPYSVLNFPKFRADFLYNYATTPVYSGEAGGAGYAEFLSRFLEIFGLPGTLLLAACALGGAGLVAFRAVGAGWKIWLLAAAVFAIYFWQIGGFPRVETRFVLPVAPFFLLLAAPGLAWAMRRPRAAVPVLAALVAYNLVCGWMVGGLFRNDPRMKALDWAAAHLSESGVMESSLSSPQWQEVAARGLRVVRIPWGLERREHFETVFAGEDETLRGIGRFETGASTDWFSSAQRAERGTRWIAWNSIDIDEVIRPFYTALFVPDSGYRIVFDAQSPKLPRWVYPQSADFLSNRMTVWEKTNG